MTPSGRDTVIYESQPYIHAIIQLDWLQSLKQFTINVAFHSSNGSIRSYHIHVASLTLIAL